MKSDDTESTLILPAIPTTTPIYVLYPQRFYVLGVFSLLTFTQCMVWLTFSPIARSAEVYYNIDEATVDLLLNWGSIIFIPFLPLGYILMNKHHGLRRCVILLAIAVFIAALIRVLPIVITSPTSPNFRSISLPFLHAGQILNAACGPLVMAPVAQLSCLWFAPHERTRATTVAILANNFGATIGFVISPYIVSSPDHVPRLLYLHLALAFVACVLTLLYFPAQPPSAPSAAAELLIRHSNSENNGSFKQYMKDVGKCLTTPSFVLISTAGGLIFGVFGTWTSLFDVILKPENYTEKQAGWFSFGASISGIIGGLFLSALADRRGFQHSLKLLIATSCIGCLIATIWFELSVPTYFRDKPILPSSVTTMAIVTALIGLFYNSAIPLIYEAIAEIMYPLPESLSTSILVQWCNAFGVILLFIAPNRSELMNLLVLITIVVCTIMILLARFSYRRRDEDERKRLETEQQQQQQQQATDHNGIHPPIYGINNEIQYGTFS